MRNLDWSKSRTLHSNHGHREFVREIKGTGKTRQFVASVCQSLECKEAADVLKNGI